MLNGLCSKGLYPILFFTIYITKSHTRRGNRKKKRKSFRNKKRKKKILLWCDLQIGDHNLSNWWMWELSIFEDLVDGTSDANSDNELRDIAVYIKDDDGPSGESHRQKRGRQFFYSATSWSHPEYSPCQKCVAYAAVKNRISANGQRYAAPAAVHARELHLERIQCSTVKLVKKQFMQKGCRTRKANRIQGTTYGTGMTKTIFYVQSKLSRFSPMH